MKLLPVFLISIILPSLVRCQNYTNNLDMYQEDDDDYFPENYNQLKSKFGNVEFQVNIFTNQTCLEKNYKNIMSINTFNFPSQCSCINSNEYCYQELLLQPYFLKHKWNFTNYSQYNSYNISKCILNHSLSKQTCFPCQDVYISMEAILTRNLCWMIDIGMIVLIICLLGCLVMCFFGYLYSRRKRLGYQTVITNNNTKYKFYTINE